LTDQLSKSLGDVTLNAPDWRTLRFIQTARRLYKPRTADLSPGQYVRLSRRFVDSYLKTIDNPDMQKFRDDVENYQSRLDMLGLKDYQLRVKVTPGQAIRKMLRRSLKMLLLLPFAIPGALLHLPVGWIAAMVGERFSYEMDDIATLKVLSTILLLPLLYLTIAIVVGLAYGWIWSMLAIVALGASFFVSVRLMEAQANLFNSIISLTKLTRRGDDVEDLQATRASLVTAVRDLAEQYSDPQKKRLFTQRDFEKQDDD
jgi:glycerol-3-phosphate O-acyltransferase/dihydroxyacetone phosphate acyltransferase